MSWLTKMSLRNRSIVGLVVVAVVIFGAIAVSSLKQELIPDLTFPYLTVFTVDPGTSPSDVERNVTTPLEQSIKTTSGVKEYDSFSNEGMSIITVQYEFGTDMKAKEAEVHTLVLVPVLYLVFDRLRPKNAYADEEVGAVPLEAETSPG